MEKSLNSEKGTNINELELMFRVLNKVLEQAIERHGGSRTLTMAKGKNNEKSMRLDEAKEALETLKDGMSIKGVFSLGICGTCQRWDCRGSSTKRIGMCGQEATGRYDTCNKHSKKGGGFGV